MDISSNELTNIIQNVVLLISVPYSIWSIVTLFRKDKDKEAKLQSLNEIATSLQVRNSKLELHLAIMQKQLDLNQAVALADRQPFFAIDSQNTLENGFSIKLKNNGNLAIISAIDLKNQDTFRLETIDLIGRRIESQASLTIQATYNDYYKKHEPDHINFPITESIQLSVSFKDSLGTEYTQQLTKREGAGILFTTTALQEKV